MDWDSPEVGEWFTEDQLAKLGPLEGNNKCRNPDDESEPWCLVGEGLGDYDICDVPKCHAEVNTQKNNKLLLFVLGPTKIWSERTRSSRM